MPDDKARRRLAIPNPVRREVRQRCGFGCVICGHPIYEIDHMEEWSTVQQHDAANLTLLCPNHHTEKTKGLLPSSTLVEANTAPLNVQRGRSAPYSLPYAKSGQSCEIHLGGNKFGTTFGPNPETIYAVVIDRTPLMSFVLDDGGLFLRLLLVDDCNHGLAMIADNELVQTTRGWDYENVANRLVVRSQRGQVALEIEFEPPAIVRVTRGTLRLNGVEVQIRGEQVTIPGYNPMLMSGCSGRNGLFLGPQDQVIEPSASQDMVGFLIGLPDIPRRVLREESSPT